MGRERCALVDEAGNSWAGFNGWPGDHGEVLRGSRGDAAGTESGSSFIKRNTVNTGTVLVLPATVASSAVVWAERVDR
jgi:hypothetical protein